MPVVYRPARMDDLKRADEIVVGSINELTERRGFGKMASPRAPTFQAFSLRDDPAGLWVDVVEQIEPATGFWERYRAS